MKQLGLRDVPIEAGDDEPLGLGLYAEALASFAKKCQTPLTIALQGDWGSGKTSLMNLIKANVKKDNPSHVLVWFNTWQYSQFGMQDELPLSLISYFLEKLGAPAEAKSLTERLKGAVHLAGTAATIMGGVPKVIGAAMVSSVAENPERPDASRDIARLKEQVAAAVKHVLGDDEERRVIVFIDDLDRLSPVKAVELLECFKLFLDIPGCVYFLACDYQVVSQGLKMKFGVGANDLKGKSFFDKIIQLPFQMPVTQYKVAQYIESLLSNIGIAYEPKDIEQYKELIESSIGFNPRNLKRAFNCLLLLKIVAEGQAFFNNANSSAKTSEKQKLIFANVCMQRAYEALYVWLVQKAGDLDQALFRKMMDEKQYETDKELATLLETLTEDDPSIQAHRIARFMRAFYAAAQLDSDDNDNNLNDDELQNLRAILTFSSVTATAEAAQEKDEYDEEFWKLRRGNRKIVNNLVEILTKNHKDFLKQMQQEKYDIYQPRGIPDLCVTVSNKQGTSPLGNAEFWLEQEDGKNLCSAYVSGLKESVSDIQFWENELLPLLPDDIRKEASCDYLEDEPGIWIFSITFPKDCPWDEQMERAQSAAEAFFEGLGKMKFA